jgi:hypothetical protein
LVDAVAVVCTVRWKDPHGRCLSRPAQAKGRMWDVLGMCARSLRRARYEQVMAGCAGSGGGSQQFDVCSLCPSVLCCDATWTCSGKRFEKHTGRRNAIRPGRPGRPGPVYAVASGRMVRRSPAARLGMGEALMCQGRGHSVPWVSKVKGQGGGRYGGAGDLSGVGTMSPPAPAVPSVRIGAGDGR